MVVQRITPQPICLPHKLQQQLTDLAQANPEQEVCGLLGGSDANIMSFYPVANIHPDIRHAFLLEPQGQVAAMREMRERGEELRGIFHSHPDTSAVPSDTDRQQAAYPDVYYVILSLKGSLPEFGLYYFDGSGFEPVSLV